MKKKLLSLVLAAMMTIGCFAGLGAAVGQDTDFSALSVEDQYAAIMAAGSEADAQALFDTLDAEQQAALSAYAEAQAEASEPETYAVPAVNYTNVAPLVTANKVSQPAKARLMSARSTARPIEKGKTADGLILNKTATPVEGSADDYKITLEAYTTGTVSTSETTKPTDIVLVLDQSGSMAWNMSDNTYSERYSSDLDKELRYYVLRNGRYTSVTWCSKCKAWTDGCWDGFKHHSGNKYTPKTSASDTADGHVQFYVIETRLDVLKKAVTGFANSVAEKAKGSDGLLNTDDDVDHRVAIVGFSSDGYQNTELLTGVPITKGSDHSKLDQTSDVPYYYPTGYVQNGVMYGSITTAQYGKALQSMKTTDGQTSVSNAINALTAHGGTETLDGLTMAENIFANTDSTGRNRVVVLFTDGDTNSNRADVVNKAYTLKNTYNATVYSVGIFDGANGQPPITNRTSEANALMHRVSSNYPDATATSYEDYYWNVYYSYNDGSLNSSLKGDDSYYLSASDSDTLSTIFQKISNQISESKINLGSDTQIKDVVSKYFDMPKNTSAVSVKSYDCTGFSDGEPTWSETGTVINNAVTLDTENNTVNVTGFDFNANYVTEKGRDETDPKKEGTFHGRKLVIEFTVTAKNGFVGGNSVPTNGSDSGVYDKDGKEVATFDVPQVNVPIKSELTVNNKVIYEGNSADVSGLYNAANTSSWEYDFVNVSYEVKNGDTAVTGSVSPADCTDYTVKATFSPKYDGKNANGKINDDATVVDTAKVHVLKPTVTVKAEDVTRYYGESYTPDGSNVNASVSWTDAKHSNITAADATGDAPYTTKDIQIGYDWVGKIGTDIVPNHDTDVNLTYKVNGNDITDKVNGDKSYKVIAKTCTLTVNKSVAKTYSNNDSFIFNVVGKGNVPYNAQVVITGNGSATLTGLPVGDYTVTEDTGWSWRYTCDSSTKSTVLSSANANDSVTITNKLGDNKYLGDETFVINKCESKTIEKVSFIQQAIDFLLGR